MWTPRCELMKRSGGQGIQIYQQVSRRLYRLSKETILCVPSTYTMGQLSSGTAAVRLWVEKREQHQHWCHVPACPSADTAHLR